MSKGKVICESRGDNFGRTCMASSPNEPDAWCRPCGDRRVANNFVPHELTDARLRNIMVQFRGKRAFKTLATELTNEIFRLRKANQTLVDNRLNVVREEVRLRAGLCDFCRCALLHQPSPDGQACKCGKR